MSIGKKILLGFGIFISIIILIGIGFYIYILLNSGDIKKIDDSALYPSSQILSKDDNAFYNFKQASDNLTSPKDMGQTIKDLASGTNWDDALATKIVNDNAVSLAVFNQGSWKKGYQDPVMQADIKTLNANTVLTSLANIRNLAEISSIKSWLLFKQGKEKEAFDNTLDIIYVGQLMENSPRVNLIGYLIGMSIKRMGITNMQSLVTGSHLNSDDFKSYITKIDKFKDNKAGLQEAFRTEYFFLNNTKEQMIDKYFYSGKTQDMQKNFGLLVDAGPLAIEGNRFFSKFYYKPNETQKLFAETYQNFIDNAAKNCNELTPQIQELELSKTKLLITENAAGKVLSHIIMVSLNSIFNKRCQEEFSVIKTQIMLASQAYKIDNGTYPASLDRLNPNYMNITYKQFDGQDIIYDSKSGMTSLAQ